MRNLGVVLLWMLCAQVTFAEPLMMEVRSVATDMAGSPISSVMVGSQFKLQTVVTDIRNPPESQPQFQGVFSAGADIFYNPALSSIDTAQTVEFGEFFTFARDANLQPGQVLGYASSSSGFGPGNAPQFLFSVVLTATATGTQTFTPTLVPPNQDYEYNMYLIDPPFPNDAILFVTGILEIVPEPSTYALAAIGMLSLLAFRRRNSAPC